MSLFTGPIRCKNVKTGGMNFLQCCKCGHHTKKFACPKCKHVLCCSCGDPDPTWRKRRQVTA